MLPSDGQQDAYTPNCVSMYPGHAAAPAGQLVQAGPGVASKPEAELYGSAAGSPGGYHHYGGWTTAPGPATPVPVAAGAHNYNPNYQGYYHQNPAAQNYISPAPPMVLYPQVFGGGINQNQIHLHLSDETHYGHKW